jgi:hypothetical protein
VVLQRPVDSESLETMCAAKTNSLYDAVARGDALLYSQLGGDDTTTTFHLIDSSSVE